MSSRVRSVHEEHAAFVPYLDEMLVLAESVETMSVAEFRQRASAIHEFLAHELMPHAAAEGRILAPLTADDEGHRQIGIQMTLCHTEVAKRTDELEVLIGDLRGDPMTPAQLRSFQRVLFGIHALLSAHFAEAEGVMEDVLEARLSEQEREEVFAKIDLAAQEVRSLYE